MLPLKNVAAATVNYTLYRTAGNRAEFHGPAHSDTNTDVVILVGNDPTKSGDSFGNRRSSCKILRSADVSATDGVSTLTRDAKIDIQSSIPVGMTESEINELFARAAEAVILSEIATDLARTGKVQF